MRRQLELAILLLALGSLFAMSGDAQSLGDVAREQRQKRQSKDTRTSRKVVTDEDIPSHPEQSSSSSDDIASSPDDKRGEPSSLPSASEMKNAGERWKATIQAQKASVASLQSQLDKLNASIHFVEANRYTNGVQYNQYQLRRQQEAERMQKQLDEQKKKLEMMQESARRAGFGSAVYDP